MSSFHELGLHQNILKALDELSFKEPTEIQAEAIPYILDSTKDVIALAQTGTGKTAAFSLPLLEKITPRSDHIQALILCPTRELCLQITKDIQDFSRYLEGITVVSVYGGERIDLQVKALRKGCQIVVGTPGRVLDLINRKNLKLHTIQYLVLDEADEMLNMGFAEDLDAILATTPAQKQTLLFSATMLPEVERMAKKYMKNAEHIQVHKRNTGTASVEHQYCMVHARDRYEALRRIADMNPDIYGIIFCRTRRETQEVSTKLIADKYPADALHGDIEQSQREYVMDRFRKKQIQLLVATDVAARGIDVSNLTHVINYNLPDQLESYIHRSGRTGRAHQTGVAITIIHMKEIGKIRQLERKIGRPFTRIEVPTGTQICEKQLSHFIEKMGSVSVDAKKIAPFMALASEKLGALGREELLQHLVSVELERFSERYENAPDLNVQGNAETHHHSSDRSRHKKGKAPNKNIAFAPFTLNLGKKDRFTPRDLFALLNNDRHLRGIEVGKIRIEDSHTEFDADQQYAPVLQNAFRNQKFAGKALFIKSVRNTAPQRNKKRKRK